MKRLFCVSAALAALLAADAAEPVSEGIGFYGKLPAASAVATKTVEFRLYGSLEPTKVLWGRRVSVKVNADGGFYVELRDDVGSALETSATTGLTLATALDRAKGDPEIGLTQEGKAEMSPRIRLAVAPRAQRAVCAQNVQSAAVGTATLGTVRADRLTVSGDLKANAVELNGVIVSVAPSNADIDIGVGDKQQAYLIGGVRGVTATYQSYESVAAETATKFDRLDTVQTTDGMVFTLPVPKGSTISAAGQVLRLSKQVFGR